MMAACLNGAEKRRGKGDSALNSVNEKQRRRGEKL
jgi:hypothetical protein